MRLFNGNPRVNDPCNTMGAPAPKKSAPGGKNKKGAGKPGEAELSRLADAIANAPDAASRKRITAYRDGVRANYDRGAPWDENGVNSAAEPYLNLTRRDFDHIYGPGTPEASDPGRRP